jgi:hypothetical protein
MLRARQTAEIVATRLGVELRVLPELREIDVGEWAGRTTAEIEAEDPAAAERRRELGYGWLDGETPEQLGVNDSATHVDFMVGSPELEIDGVEPGGATMPLLREGRWQLQT